MAPPTENAPSAPQALHPAPMHRIDKQGGYTDPVQVDLFGVGGGGRGGTISPLECSNVVVMHHHWNKGQDF